MNLHALIDVLLPRRPRSVRAVNADTGELFARCTQPTTRSLPDALVAAPYTDSLVRDIIHALKYDRITGPARTCAEVLHPLIFEFLADARTLDGVTDPLLVPVPLARKRMRERGFNHSERITAELAALDGGHSFIHAPRALARVHETPQQTQQEDDVARFRNMERAFRADAQYVSGHDIILLDDVITTGATMRSAIDALETAGARHILPVAFAAARCT